MAKTEFLQRMSHDIRTPINGIRGMVEIGDRCPEDMARQADCRKKIWEASTLLLELVNEVLDMGKLESGEVVLENVPFDLPELIHEITDVLEKQAEERGIVLHREYGRLPHPRLVGSPLHVKRLLMNVLSNAIKYNREKGRVMLDCFELSCTGGQGADLLCLRGHRHRHERGVPEADVRALCAGKCRGRARYTAAPALECPSPKVLWIRWAVPSGWKASRA